MTSVSAVVITKNEERQIADCLAGLGWSDELVVLDAGSADRTVEICRGFTERVYQREFVNFPTQRNAAMQQAQGDWILFVDADERVPPGLAREVREVVDTPGEEVAYGVPRRNFIWGKWIKHGGWYPDYQLRLLRRGYARYDESRGVHELVVVEGSTGHLKNELIHYNYDTLGQFLSKQDAYASLQALTWRRAGQRPKAQNFFLQPLREFRRRYLALQGYRDGLHGLLLALLLAYYEFLTYVRLRRLWALEGG